MVLVFIILPNIMYSLQSLGYEVDLCGLCGLFFSLIFLGLFCDHAYCIINFLCELQLILFLTSEYVCFGCIFFLVVDSSSCDVRGG